MALFNLLSHLFCRGIGKRSCSLKPTYPENNNPTTLDQANLPKMKAKNRVEGAKQTLMRARSYFVLIGFVFSLYGLCSIKKMHTREHPNSRPGSPRKNSSSFVLSQYPSNKKLKTKKDASFMRVKGKIGLAVM